MVRGHSLRVITAIFLASPQADPPRDLTRLPVEARGVRPTLPPGGEALFLKNAKTRQKWQVMQTETVT